MKYSKIWIFNYFWQSFAITALLFLLFPSGWSLEKSEQSIQKGFLEITRQGKLKRSRGLGKSMVAVTLDLMCVFAYLTLHAQNVPPQGSEQALEDLIRTYVSRSTLYDDCSC